MKRLALVTVLLGAAAGSADAQITRTEILDRAQAFVYYPWRAEAKNLTASCVPNYDSAYVPGDYMGVAYDWGGFDSLFQFDQKLEDGYGAGTPAFGDVYSCTTGVDCSGFVSQSWHTNTKYGTSTMEQVSSEVSVSSMLPGDAFNEAGFHCTMFSHMLGNGEPYMYEAVGYNTHTNATGGWSYVNGFLARRYQSVVGTSVSTPVGTLNHPIAINSFPFTDSRNTANSQSDVLDGCGASPGSNESGPEFVYQVQITQPGQLSVSVTDDVSADIDVHLATSWNTGDCIARHDSAFTQSVDCGTYYVVADTFRSGGVDQVGAFDLVVDFSPSGGGCGSGPPDYDFEGGLGESCAYPGDPNQPFCNPTLEAEVCLYTDTDSFCSKSCATSSDCSDMPGGGCCEDIGSGEMYCLTSDFCSVASTPDAGAVDPGGQADAGPGGGGPGGGGGNGDDSSGGCAVGDNFGDFAWLLIVLFATALLWRRRTPANRAF